MICCVSAYGTATRNNKCMFGLRPGGGAWAKVISISSLGCLYIRPGQAILLRTCLLTTLEDGPILRLLCFERVSDLPHKPVISYQAAAVSHPGAGNERPGLG
jgi:hypothetical protein